jgi:phosphohistidine phosphatase
MMLFLMRHAHTEQSLEGQDFERVLTDRGKTEADEVANFLKTYKVDKMIVSYVKRTVQTANIIQEKMLIPEIEIVTELYNSNKETVLNLICNQEGKNILVVGHNPLIYTLALEIAENTNEKFEFLAHSSMPPARIIAIDFPSIQRWNELKDNKGQIVEIFTPTFKLPI